MGRESLSLFCKNFVAMTRKWGICPDDLGRIASERAPPGEGFDDAGAGRRTDANSRVRPDDAVSVSENDVEALIRSILLPNDCADDVNDDISDSIDDDVAGQAVMYNSRELDAQKQSKGTASAGAASHWTNRLGCNPSAYGIRARATPQ